MPHCKVCGRPMDEYSLPNLDAPIEYACFNPDCGRPPCDHCEPCDRDGCSRHEAEVENPQVDADLIDWLDSAGFGTNPPDSEG